MVRDLKFSLCCFCLFLKNHGIYSFGCSATSLADFRESSVMFCKSLNIPSQSLSTEVVLVMLTVLRHPFEITHVILAEGSHTRPKMAVFHDEVEIEDFEYDEESETYFYPCPCGDQFEITKVCRSALTTNRY